jgi:hypothetical protein
MVIVLEELVQVGNLRDAKDIGTDENPEARKILSFTYLNLAFADIMRLYRIS